MKVQGRAPKKSVWIKNITFGLLGIMNLVFYWFIAYKWQQKHTKDLSKAKVETVQKGHHISGVKEHLKTSD